MDVAAEKDDWITAPAATATVEKDDWITAPAAKAEHWAAPSGGEFGDLEAQSKAPAQPQGQIAADLNSVGQGLVSGTGSAIAGAGRIAQRGTGPEATRMLAALDLVDQGKDAAAYAKLTDAQRMLVTSYRRAGPDDRAAQRDALQQTIADADKPNAAIRAGMAVEDAAPKIFPVEPQNEGIQTGVGRLIGGAAPALAAGAVGGPVGVLASLATIGSQAYDGTYQDAVSKGATHDDADDAAGKSALAQAALMVAPVGRLLQRVPMPMRDGLTATLVNLGQHGVEFGSANALGTFANNYVAQQSYDPSRSLTQGTGHAALEGAIAGLIIPTVAGAVRGARQPVATVDDVMKAPDVDSAIAAAGEASRAPADDAAPATGWSDLFKPKDAGGAPPDAPVPARTEETSVPATQSVAADPTAIPTTSAAAKQIASAFYQKADQVGGTLTPEFTNKFIDKAESVAPQTEEGRAVAGDTAITGLVDRIQALRDKPISLKGAQEIDERLGDMIDGEFGLKGLSKEGHNLLDLQSTFRDMILNAGPSDTTNGTAGFEAIQQGRIAWAQAMKMMDFERILNRAEQTDNPVTSIRTGIRTLLSNPSRARGYTPEEKNALQDAANRGVLGSVLHVFGSRLTPLAIGAVGMSGGVIPGLLAAGATHAATSAMRSAATSLQTRRTDKAMSVLGSSVPQSP